MASTPKHSRPRSRCRGPAHNPPRRGHLHPHRHPASAQRPKGGRRWPGKDAADLRGYGALHTLSRSAAATTWSWPASLSTAKTTRSSTRGSEAVTAGDSRSRPRSGQPYDGIASEMGAIALRVSIRLRVVVTARSWRSQRHRQRREHARPQSDSLSAARHRREAGRGLRHRCARSHCVPPVLHPGCPRSRWKRC